LSISDAILALSPSLYWKLDELAGPTAFDSSGNGLNGQYQPSLAFDQPGPEAGTFSVGGTTVGSGVVRSGSPITGTVPMSMLCWFAEAVLNGANSSVTLMYAGQIGARGFGSLMNPFNGTPSWVWHGALVQATSLAATAGAWHLLALTWDSPAGGTYTYQIDLGTRESHTGHAYTAILSTDTVAAQLPGTSQLAHYALFDYVLTNAQVQSVYSGATTPLNTPSGVGRALTDFDLAAIKGELQQIYAAVHKAY
jgi:hypothetical protein